MNRLGGRKHDEMRDVFLGPNYAKYAAGSCFVKFGNTHVICAATIEEKVPAFLKNTGSGWVTAEYGMLPCSSHERIEREAAKGRQSGRTQEIQRLISRSLRTCLDLGKLGERQIKIDCDVIQADGGTRTASITGAYVSLYFAVKKLLKNKKIKENPIIGKVAAVSCGIVGGQRLLDLDYEEDSSADVDANFVMNENFELVEVQVTAENKVFSTTELKNLLDLAGVGIKRLIDLQNAAIKSVD